MKYSTEHILSLANALIEKADASDVVITIQTAPKEPLAMGNFDMVASVRARRASHTKGVGANEPPYRNLYEITGNIGDINTLLVTRNQLLEP